MKKLLMLLALAASAAQADQAEEIAAFMLNVNGLLCAEVVELNALEQKKVYEVQCIKYRGGSATATYLLDMNTGVAWEE